MKDGTKIIKKILVLLKFKAVILAKCDLRLVNGLIFREVFLKFFFCILFFFIILCVSIEFHASVDKKILFQVFETC
jgi:hypothetical protein